MKNEKGNFTRLTSRATCMGLMVCACVLACGLSAFAQKYPDDTYGAGGSKEIGKTIEYKDSSGNKVLLNVTTISDSNKVTRELHFTYTDPVTKKVVRQRDAFYDCKGHLTSSKEVNYDQLGNEIYRKEEKFKDEDDKQTSGFERGTDTNGKKFNRRYNPNTKKYEDVDVAFEPPSEISAPRDTSVCPINTYANQLVGGFDLIREDSAPDNFNTYGVDFSFTHHFQRPNTLPSNTGSSILSHVGVTADFNVNFRTLGGVDLTKTSGLGGITFVPFHGLTTHDKVTVSLEALAGISHLTSSVGSVSASQNSFTMKLGAAVDVNVNQHFFIRPIGVDYAPTFFGNTTQNNIQVTFAAGFRFGHTGSTATNVPKGP